MPANVLNKLVAFNKETTEAFVKSSTAAYKAFEELTVAAKDVASKSAAQNDAAIKALLAVKSPTEFADLQGRLTRETVEAAIADSRKLVELASAAYSAAVEPLNSRVAALQALTPAAFTKFAA